MTGVSAPATSVQWARLPGPVGGVTRAVEQLVAALDQRGAEVGVVDFGRPSSVLARWRLLLRRNALHQVHLTRLWRTFVLGPLLALVPGRTVLVLHSGSTAGQMSRHGRLARAALQLSLRCFDEIWAMNDGIVAALPPGLARRARVVSPYSSSPVTRAESTREPHACVVATNAGQEHYDAETAVEAVRQLRADGWPDATLHVLAYGARTDRLRAFEDAVRDLDWVHWTFDLPPEAVTDLLGRCAVLLRPTMWDGDSMLVREALALGLRVVATDVCPRPVGVETAERDPAAFARAVRDGGRPADGSGLGEPLDTATFAALVRVGSRRAADVR